MIKITVGVALFAFAIYMAWQLVEMNYFLLLIVPGVLLDLSVRIAEDGAYG